MYYRKQIWVQSRRSMSEQADIHARLMAKYPQVPDWWYAVIFGKRHCVFLVLWPLTVDFSGHVRIRCRLH